MRLKQLLPFLLAALVAILGLQLMWQTPVAAGPQDSCATPDINGATDLIDEDMIWDGEIYVGTNFTIRGNSTLTITPGTRVIFCGDYSVSIGSLFSPAKVIAIGTAAEPIVFEPADGVSNWGTFYFGDSLPEVSVLQHVEFHSGGSDGDEAAVTISGRHAIITQTSPIIDQVSIVDSAGYGMSISMNTDNDPTPAAISNLTITGSGNSPIYTVGSGVSALNGPLTLTGNMTQTIEVYGFAMYFDQVWRDHGVPYHIEDTIRMRSNEPFQPFSTWHIEPGVEILMGGLANLTIDGDARIDWQGTADDPIVIKQHDEAGDPWGELSLSASEPGPNKLAHVELIKGGGLADSLASATIKNAFGGTLELDYVTVTGSQNAGLYNSKGFNATNRYTVNNSHFEANLVGIKHWSGSGVIRNSSFINNFEYGIENSNPRDYCLDAGGNYWGASSGPNDSTTVGGQCNDADITNAGTGNVASDGVLYFPWLTDSDTSSVTDHSSLSVGDKLWIIANGVDEAPVELTLRDENGDPVAGKQIEFRTTNGEFSVASGTTDSSGQLMTNLTATETGNTYVTAFNVTDNVPVAAKLSVYFWQGGSDTGGLVDRSGSPYASPELVVEGEPFEAGLPVIFKLPMQNTQSSPLQVDVTYTVQGFGIASGGELVSSPSAVLQPDEAWDALGGFTPADTGHRCVIYDVTYTDETGTRVVEAGGSFGGQRNLKNPKPPCQDLNANDLVPGKPGGLSAVVKHFAKVIDQTNKVSKCLDTQLTFRRSGLALTDFSSPIVLQSFTPSAYAGEAGESQALVDAVNVLTQLGGDIAALNLAIAEARNQTNRAAQADEWQAAADRLAQVREFEAARVEKLQAYGAGIDTFIGLLDVATLDTVFTSDDYDTYLAQLKTTGFDAETIAYHQSTGLSAAEIDAMLQTTIAALENDGAASGSSTLRAILLDLKASIAAEASGQSAFLNVGIAAGSSRSGAADEAQTLIGLGTIQETFEVGNPTTITDTVELVVRTGDMPPQWTYELDQDTLELGPGETTTVTLTVDTGLLPVVADETFYFGVEGFIDDEYIGGVMFEQRIPVNPAGGASTIFLPMITR